MSSERRKPYPHDEFEPRWQARWDAEKTFRTPGPGDADFDPTKPKYYVLDMFPYPSGAGLHVGHPEGYTATDILGRTKRMQGHNVLHPMGWDAFGLPAEQYAIKTGQHPRVTTEANIENFRRQLKSLGFAYDWDREVNTTDPGYVRWTQWIFLQLYHSYYCEQSQKARPVSELEAKGWSREQIDAVRLAFVADTPVWWSPTMGTVLANEEVEEWKNKGETVERRPLRQWMLRITKYAQRLIDELDDLDWPEGIKLLQKNWIGRSEGAEVKFSFFSVQCSEGTPETSAENCQLNSENSLTVFTTRPDTLFGATYMVLAPENPLVPQITTSEQKSAVEAYQKACTAKSDMERGDLNKDKSGVFTGAYAVNPVNGEQIPVWIADYVMMGYGTGAIMAVPAHDERDFEFAKKFGLNIKPVVAPEHGDEFMLELPDDTISPLDRDSLVARYIGKPELFHGLLLPFISHGIAVSSNFLDGLPTVGAKQKMIAWLEEKGLGKRRVQFKLRDWLFSRQRYWGEPFPVVWEGGEHRAIPDSELPLLQPELEDFKPTGDPRGPLIKATDWIRYSETAQRETNTMPQWAGSCWYYLRYCDPKNSERFISKEAEAYWLGGWQPSDGECLFAPDTWKSVVAAMIERALTDKGKRPPFTMPFARVSDEFARLAQDAAGEILAQFVHAFDVYSVRHTFNQHGSPTRETARGCEAVTEEDILHLPQILAEPDSVEFVAPHPGGLKRFVSKKRINGTICIVEEMRGRRGQLHLITFWKQKTATARDVTPKAPLSYTSETFRRTPDDALSPASVKTGAVDLYVGGTEHAVLHLLYARFWHKVLFDLGHLSTPEPFQRLVNQGLILGEDGQKMSKSLGNVVNPDDVVSEYGADSLRLYEMFMGPLEQVKPWSMKGVEGVSRFLARVWRLAFNETESGWSPSPKIADAPCTDKALRRVVHETIRKVTEDVEKLSFNTAISQMMICTNAFTAATTVPLAEFVSLLLCLNPFAPHLTEETYARLRESFPQLDARQLCQQTWPQHDPAALVVDEIEIVVQVNGKLRDKVTVATSADNAAVEAAALASPKIIEAIGTGTVAKVIVVPKKLVNIVVK